MKFLFYLIISVSLIVSQNTIMGFNKANSEKQKALEEKFDANLKSQNLYDWMEFMSSKPHHVGSKHGKANAEFMAAKFREWGFDTEIKKYYVLYPSPKERVLEIVGSDIKLLQEEIQGDENSDHLPPFNAFSIDGDVTAELVFVNQGLPRDYEELDKRGISVKGKIVIAKYGGSWRGIKAKIAGEKGAIGCILYSDPRDDGYSRGDVYPKGAYKNEYGVQRGSVMDMPYHTGDPLTPFIPSTKNAKRLKATEAKTLTKIPVLPISYKDAQHLLRGLEGPTAPSRFVGSLPLTYHIGPGPIKVHLKVKFNWKNEIAYNVIAKIKGSEFPDQWIIRGNHHDAWVNGASDPVSGMVVTMEEARSIGLLVKQGFRPKRTLVYCAWDAEEPGLIGSTEWVEDNAKTLKKKAVAYINTDSNGRGFFGAGGSHSLQKFVRQIAEDVMDPQTNISLADRSRAANIVNNGRSNYKKFELYAMGSGSDYTPFIQHLGISALNFGFGGESGGGEYHTMYDNFDHYTRFKDPGFVYGITLAKAAGRATLRMANADVLPFEFTELFETINSFANELYQMPDKMRANHEEINKNIDENLYVLSSDPKKYSFVSIRKKDVPYVNFSPIKNSLSKLNATIRNLKNPDFDKMSKKDTESFNTALYQIERLLIHEKGLPGRPWFKHHLYAPGFYTGYGVKTLPGVREAMEAEDWKLVDEQIVRLAGILEKLDRQLNDIYN